MAALSSSTKDDPAAVDSAGSEATSPDSATGGCSGRMQRVGLADVASEVGDGGALIDLSGRPFCVWKANVPIEMLGTFNAPLAEEFWRAVSSSGAFNLHVLCHYGRNTHHIVEGIFKATARALRQATEMDQRSSAVPSTKGVL